MWYKKKKSKRNFAHLLKLQVVSSLSCLDFVEKLYLLPPHGKIFLIFCFFMLIYSLLAFGDWKMCWIGFNSLQSTKCICDWIRFTIIFQKWMEVSIGSRFWLNFVQQISGYYVTVVISSNWRISYITSLGQLIVEIKIAQTLTIVLYLHNESL